MVTVTFDDGAALDPLALEEAVREVEFTPTGIRAWIEGRVLNEEPPLGAPPGGVVFEASGTRQRFIVTADPGVGAEHLDALRGSAAAVITITGRATKLDGVDEVIIHLEETASRP